MRHGTAILCFLGWTLAGCGHHEAAMTPSGGVVWDRITPAQVIDPDRPDWRTDSIAFETDVNGKEVIAIAREDGSGIELQPAPGTSNERAPRWVTGGLLVYASDFTGFPELWYREIASGVTRRLTSFNGAGAPAPRPHAPGLCYVGSWDPLSGGQLALLPDTATAPLVPLALTPGSILAGEPDWNPGGDQICFTVLGSDSSSTIWRMSLADTLPIQLTIALPHQVDRSPRWSPDGTRILFASNRGGLWGVWTVSPSGQAQGMNVVAQDVGEIRHPCWSPDGSQILLSSDRSGDRALWKLSNVP